MNVQEAMEKTVTPAIRARMDRMLCNSIRTLIPHRLNRLTVSQWAEAHRILPASVTPMPGPFRFDVVPYLREIADNFSESSPVQKVVVMKGAQVAFTTAVLENIIGYLIAAAPGPAMFISADKGVAESSVELRIDAMIASAGLQDKIFAQVEKKHGKATGDKKSRKDFPGGFLMAIGPRVGAKLRNAAVRYLFGDEVDAWPAEIGGAEKGSTVSEGDTLALAETRTRSFSRTRKILLGSTPLIKQTSRIEGLFLEGDQRYFEVPCPTCKTMQPLRWRDDEGNHPLKYETDEAGRLVPGSVYYECAACGAHWTNDDKAWFLPRGQWRPTAEAREPGLRSYHISALYSPVGMRTWEDIAREFVGIGDDVAKLRTFINTTLGESFEERGFAPRPERIMARREGYRAGTLPETARPLFITMGVDVQDDRIEAEIVAWGRGMQSWSIEYLRFDAGKDGTADLENDAWKQLRACIQAEHAGFLINMVLIDEGGGHENRTEVVRNFCERYTTGKVLPVKGEGGGKGADRIFSRREIAGHSVPTILLNVSLLKETVYSFLNRGTPDGKPPREPFPGYCAFPIDYGEEFFRMLSAEEKFYERGRDGRRVVKWRKRHTRNEALDARTYAMGGLYMLFDARRRELLTDDAKASYSWDDLWDYAEKRRGMRPQEAPVDPVEKEPEIPTPRAIAISNLRQRAARYGQRFGEDMGGRKSW